MNVKFTEYEAVKQLLEDYAAAVYSADIEKLTTLFHPAAAMSGYLGDKLIVGNIQPFYQDLQQKPSMEFTKDDFRHVISGIKIVKNIATANLFVDGFYGEMCIQDCFHLVKENGVWKIVSKTFTTL